MKDDLVCLLRSAAVLHCQIASAIGNLLFVDSCAKYWAYFYS